MRINRIIGIQFAILLSGCTTASIDVSSLQKSYSEAMQSSENLVQKAQTDYREKSVLVDNLRKGGSSEFKSSEADILRRLNNMEALMQKITAQRKQMVKANAEIASTGYNRSQVNAGDPEYDRLNEASQDFQEAARELNRSAVAYSLESNSLADLITQKQLFFTLDTVEFDKRLRDSIRTSQENLKEMEKELFKLAEQADPKNLKEEIENVAQVYSTTAQKLAPLGKDLNDLTAGMPRISSMDANWPQVQKVVGQFEQSVKELGRLNEDFQKKLENFRSSFKANR